MTRHATPQVNTNGPRRLNSPAEAQGRGSKSAKPFGLKGFATYVPDGFTCASACAAAWLAGFHGLSERSHIGFHAMYENKNGLPRSPHPATRSWALI